MGKFDGFDPNNLKSANGFKIKVSAVCCSPYSGYMDSRVAVSNYTIGNEKNEPDDPKYSIRPIMKPTKKEEEEEESDEDSDLERAFR